MAAHMPVETTIDAMIVLDADGNRICSKYYTTAFMGKSAKQLEFEQKLHQKTRGSTARPDAEIMLMDGTIAVFRSSVDSIFYVIGHSESNELILGHLLDGLFEAVSGLLKGQVEKILLLENLELLLLAMDELVDKGMILETDPLAVANRVLMRGVDGDEPAADWTQFAKAAAMAKESLERAFRQ